MQIKDCLMRFLDKILQHWPEKEPDVQLDYIDEKTIREQMYAVAYEEIGVKEIKGGKHNARILEYHQLTGAFSDDETPWCSSFVNWVCDQVDIPGTGSAAARSWLKWGRKTNDPKLGDVVVLWRGSKSGWQGHVGLVYAVQPESVLVLGGNQSDAVNIQVYPKYRVLGYRSFS